MKSFLYTSSSRRLLVKRLKKQHSVSYASIETNCIDVVNSMCTVFEDEKSLAAETILAVENSTATELMSRDSLERRQAGSGTKPST